MQGILRLSVAITPTISLLSKAACGKAASWLTPYLHPGAEMCIKNKRGVKENGRKVKRNQRSFGTGINLNRG